MGLVEVAKWPNTYMVGGVLAVLESLDPLPAAIVKMSTVFYGKFMLSDLIASACSRYLLLYSEITSATG